MEMSVIRNTLQFTTGSKDREGGGGVNIVRLKN